MQLAIQQVVNLLVLWSTYTMIAIGLSLVFSVMRVINFAHAQLYVVGAYAVYVFVATLHWNYFAALVVAGAIAAVIGSLTERFVIRPVGDNALRAMIGTLGVLLAIEGGVLVLFGPQDKYIPAPFPGQVTVLSAFIPVQKLVVAAVALATVLGLFAYLRWAKVGQALRALAQDSLAARLQGVRVQQLRLIGFAIGSFLAGLAGALILPLASVNPSTGDPILVKMFIIIVLGGLGSIEGAVVGAGLLALIETVGVTFLGDFAILGIYLLVVVVLIVRPKGLLAREI